MVISFRSIRTSLAVIMAKSISVSSTVTWVCEKPLSLLYRVGFYILKWGLVPQHVAVIMDGNRRFAKKIQIQRIEGHEKG